MHKFKFLPAIVGLFLGIIPIIGHNAPDAIAQFSGMASIASPVGYVLSIFVVVWASKGNWKEYFASGLLTMNIAFFSYYLSVHILFYQLGAIPDSRTLLLPIRFPPQPLPATLSLSLISFAQWAAISAVVCAIVATIVWVLQHSKSKALKLVGLITTYASLLGILYIDGGRRVIGWYTIARENGWFTPSRFGSHLFEIAVPLVLATVLFGIGLKNIIRTR